MPRVNHASGRDQTSSAGTPSAVPLEGAYLTDGEALFHIERTLVYSPHGDPLVELEDCATLDLIVCSARSLSDLGLRPVQPLAHSAP